MRTTKLGISLSAALLAGMIGLTGCGNGANDNGNVRTNQARGTQEGRLGMQSAGGGAANGTRQAERLELSQDIADRITGMTEVRTANVLLSGRSAYVAVELDNGNGNAGVSPRGVGRGDTLSGTGQNRLNGTATNNRSNSTPYGFGYGNRNTTGGTANGMNATGGMRTGGTAGMDGVAGYNGGGMNAAGTGMGGTLSVRSQGGNGMGVAGTGVQGTGTGVPGSGGGGIGTGAGNGTGAGTGTAGTGTTGAGAAGTGTGMGMGAGTGSTAGGNNNGLTHHLKQKIVNEVKRNARNVDAVYVSADPEFVAHVNGYADRARNGYPLEGFVNEFRTLTNRIFPHRMGDNNR